MCIYSPVKARDRPGLSLFDVVVVVVARARRPLLYYIYVYIYTYTSPSFSKSMHSLVGVGVCYSFKLAILERVALGF